MKKTYRRLGLVRFAEPLELGQLVVTGVVGHGGSGRRLVVLLRVRELERLLGLRLVLTADRAVGGSRGGMVLAERGIVVLVVVLMLVLARACGS